MADDGLHYGMLVREVISYIERHGWRLKRSDGSHGQYVSPDKRHLVTLTINHRSAVCASPVIKKLQAAMLRDLILRRDGGGDGDGTTPKKSKKVSKP